MMKRAVVFPHVSVNAMEDTATSLGYWNSSHAKTRLYFFFVKKSKKTACVT